MIRLKALTAFPLREINSFKLPFYRISMKFHGGESYEDCIRSRNFHPLDNACLCRGGRGGIVARIQCGIREKRHRTDPDDGQMSDDIGGFDDRHDARSNDARPDGWQRKLPDDEGSTGLKTEKSLNQMISFEDCIGLCGLTEAEIAAIAEHEHVPEVAAAILGQYLLHQQHGPERIRQMLVDDIRAAMNAGNIKHAAELASALRHLIAAHPEAAPTTFLHETRCVQS